MQRIPNFILPVAAAAALAGCGVDASERHARADSAFAAHHFVEARLDYATVLSAQPENRRVMHQLARTYLALEDPVAAQGMLDRLSAGAALSPDQAAMYGQALLMQGDFIGAIKRVEGADTADACRVAALAWARLGEAAKADEAFARGSRAPGAKGDLYADHARILIERADREGARALAAKAMSVKPAPVSAYLVNAAIAEADEEAERALQWFEKALAAYPGNRQAKLGRIAALGALGRIDAVRPLVAELRKSDPNDREVLVLAARLAAEDGDWREVRDLLQPLERDLEANPDANSLYAESLLALGQAEQARIRLTAQMRREPENLRVRQLLARARKATGEGAPVPRLPS